MHIVVGGDRGRVVLSPERVPSRSRQLLHRSDCMAFAIALAMLPCQTSTCLLLKKILLPISSTRAPARSHAAGLGPWPCSSVRSTTSPVLQAHETWAGLVNSSAGEIPCLLLGSGGALRPQAQRRRSYQRVTAELLRDRSRTLAIVSGHEAPGSGWVFVLPESPKKRWRIRRLHRRGRIF